tara:strand:+ start:369 stop:2063 length:1695 start_codon:yes stop_codon:yes gene_type:complete
MKIFFYNFKIIVQILFVIIFLFTTPAKSLDKFNKGDRISDYFSGILSFNENKYDDSSKFLKKLNGLESSHLDYSIKYLYSQVNSGNFKEAYNYSKKLEKKKLDSFESNLITGIFHLKNSNKFLAQEYFFKAQNGNTKFILNKYVSSSLYNWSSLYELDFNQASLKLKKIDERFSNLKKIQNVFLNCFFDNFNTKNLYNELISDQNTDFSRYNYFYASFLASSGKIDEAKNIVNSGLRLYPRNLLLNQYKIDLKNNKNISAFNCRNNKHVIAEILYITANALSSQSLYSLSNFYLNLAKYLNDDFNSYDTLLAENFYKTENFIKAKKIYNILIQKGKAFKWYSSKQLARILVQEENYDEAIKLMAEAYDDLIFKDVYVTFDYAEFLKNNEKFKDSITYYNKIIKILEKDNPLYAEATDGRGVAYERIGEWDKAEKDLLASLKADPNQAYVLNYLAYSWIEQNVKINESLSMLKKANKIKSNDPFIIDSLGWALFKLKRYKESKNYLQQAVRLMPADPIVNDHYGDVLWKNGQEIQARYYWNYVMGLKKTEEKLKTTIEKKLTKGL